MVFSLRVDIMLLRGVMSSFTVQRQKGCDVELSSAAVLSFYSAEAQGRYRVEAPLKGCDVEFR